MQRCRAKSKRNGEQCKNYAIKDWGVCRMHGAGGGPKTPRGIIRCQQSSLKHGFYTQKAIVARQMLVRILKDKK